MKRVTTAAFAVLFASTAFAQARPADPNDPRALLHGKLREVGTWVEKAADLVPADKYNYKPVGTVRTYGQLVAHVADGMNWYCANASGKKTEWSDAVEKGKTDKASIVAALKAAHSNCHTVTNTGQLKELMENIGHTNLHYGNMITYIRMLGMTPPSS
jgi:uncharacterized damage-inducible protein DinB